MDVSQYIKPEFLIMIPVLYILGVLIKNSVIIKDSLIPAALSLISVVLSLIYVLSVSEIFDLKSLMGAVFTAFTQGFLVAGATVLCNQIKKQNSKKDDEDDENNKNDE